MQSVAARDIAAGALGVCMVCGIAQAAVIQSRTGLVQASEVHLCAECAADSDVFMINNGIRRRLREAHGPDTRERTVVVQSYTRRPAYRRPRQQYRTAKQEASLSWRDVTRSIWRVVSEVVEQIGEDAGKHLALTRGINPHE